MPVVVRENSGYKRGWHPSPHGCKKACIGFFCVSKLRTAYFMKYVVCLQLVVRPAKKNWTPYCRSIAL